MLIRLQQYSFGYQVVKEPFKKSGQLLSIHAFIQKDGMKKQLPLVFALMSRKTESDYFAVFTAIKEKLNNFVVDNFVLDFEQGKLQY